MSDLDLDLDLDYDEEVESGSPSDDDSGSGSYGSYGSSDDCEEDREYTGDMFSKGENRKFMAGTFKSAG